MSDTNSKLHIEVVAKDRYFDTLIVEGLSVQEMDYIMNATDDGKRRDDKLAEIMDNHPNDSTYGRNIGSAWRYGYGIYSIKHFGGHLLVEVGNNCD